MMRAIAGLVLVGLLSCGDNPIAEPDPVRDPELTTVVIVDSSDHPDGEDLPPEFIDVLWQAQPKWVPDARITRSGRRYTVRVEGVAIVMWHDHYAFVRWDHVSRVEPDRVLVLK